MKIIRFSAKLRWGKIDRTVASFVAEISPSELEEAGAFMKALHSAGLEIQIEELYADAPVVVEREVRS